MILLVDLSQLQFDGENFILLFANIANIQKTLDLDWAKKKVLPQIFVVFAAHQIGQ
jgi:hypothetical protein